MTQQQTQIETTYAELRSSTVGALLSPRFGYSVLKRLYEFAYEQGRAEGAREARAEQRAGKDAKKQQDAESLRKRLKATEAELVSVKASLRNQAVELLELKKKRGTVTA